MLHLDMRSAGFVLVGGHSSRMGQDKALLFWQAQPLVAQIAQSVLEAAGSVTLVGAPDRYEGLNFPRLSDVYAEQGPLGGVEAALGSTRARELNLVVACDLPDLAGLGTPLLQSLLAEAERSNRLCIAAEDPDGRVHPLCAVYRVDSLSIIRECLRMRMLRLSALVTRLGGGTVKVTSALANVNTPEEWMAWQTR